jgi:hypothetical protein
VAARDAFTVVLGSSPREELRVTTMIGLLELSAQMGDRLGFSRWKREIGASAEHLPPERRADFHLQVGLGCAAFNQRRSADKSLRTAVAIGEQHHLNEYVFRAESALSMLNDKSTPNATGAPAASGAEDPREYTEIAQKLHALAS